MTLLRALGHCALVVSMSLAISVSAMAQTRFDVTDNLAAEPVAATTEPSTAIDSTSSPSPNMTQPEPARTVTMSPMLPPANNGGALQVQGVPGGTVPWSIVVLLTVLTLIPSILLCVTPFARLLIVFHFLRQALGLQTTPSNQTLIGLSLILTFFLMQPVAQQIYDTAVVPMQGG
jgi:flagellar biosynthetic protein FliP